MTTAAAAPIDRAELLARIEDVNLLMRTHAGAVELHDVSAEGVVSVRFVGMCQGCRLRPMTLFGLIRPALVGLEGVTDVQAHGVRISEEATQRANEALATEGTPFDDLFARRAA